MSINLVEIACFNFPTDSDFLLFTSILEGEGIPFACPERLQLEMQPYLSIGLGGLRVLVHDYNAEKGRILLDNMKAVLTEESVTDQFGVNHAPLSTDLFDTEPYDSDTETHPHEAAPESHLAKPFKPETQESAVEANEYDDLQTQPTWDRIRFWLVILLVGYLVYTLVIE